MADRYWVGGTGTWDATSTTNWSDTSGGAAGFSAPTAADNVFFDANSNVGTGAFTVTVSGALCNDFNVGSPTALDGAMTLAMGSSTLTVSGSWTNQATNFSVTNTAGTITFNATTTGKTITTNGVTIGVNTTLNGVGGAWTLGSAFSCGANILTLTNGTFDTSASNYAVTAGGFSSSNSNTRTINLNGSTVTLSGLSPWAMSTSTNATLNAGTSTISLSGTSGFQFEGGGLTYYNVSFTGTTASAGGRSILNANTFNNLTISTIASAGLNNIFLNANQTINGTLTVNGSNGNRRMFVSSNVVGTSRTLTCASIAAMTDVDFRDITIAGAHGTLSGTRLGDCGGNSNITFVAGTNKYWNLAAGGNWNATAWATSSGGGVADTNYPLPQDTVIIENTGLTAGNTITINGTWNIGTLDTSTRTNAMTLAATSVGATFYGNFTYGSGVTPTGTGNYTFSNRSTKTINSGGKAFTQPIFIDAPGGGIQLVTNNLTTSQTTTLTRGTLDLNNLTLTTFSFASTNSNTRTIAFGTGNISCSGTGTVWTTATSTNLTTTGTQVVNVTSAGSTLITVSPGTLSEANSISFNFTGGIYALSFLAAGSSTAKNVNFTGYSGTWQATSTGTIFGNLTLSTGMSLTASSLAMTFGATSGTQLITTNGKTLDFPITFNGIGGTFRLEDAMTVGSTRTTTLTNGTLNLNDKTLTTGLFSSTNSNTRTIAFGTGNITCTGTGTAWTTSVATNLTTTGTQVVNVTSSGSTAITVAPGALSETNSISFNFTGGTYALNFLSASGHTARNVNFTGYAGTLGATSGVTIFGNLTLSTGMSLTASASSMLFGATSGTRTITSNGKTMDFQINFNAPGATYVLQDAMTVGSTRNTAFTAGTVDLAGFTLTTGVASSQGSSTRNITFNGGTLLISGSGSTAWNATGAGGLSTTQGIGTGTISMTSASAKTFVGGGFTYNCTLNQAGAGTLTITGANTFNDITETVPTANQITFPASTTTTVNAFTLSGSSGNLVSLRSSTPGTRFTLSDPSGTVSVSFLDIQDSNATGGAIWQSFIANGNVNSGNNLGWLFAAGNYVDAAASVTADATVTGLPTRIRLFAGDISASAAIASLAYRIRLFAGDITGNASVEGQGIRVRIASGDVTGNATVSGTGNITAGGAASVTGFADVSAYGSATYSFNPVITATADVVANGQIVGEEWGDTTPTSSTWTTSSPEVSGWSNVTGTSSTWLRQ